MTLPILIHGDAAFPGQGIVAETLNLSQLAGYRTGGSIHVIVNNQLGFTTPPEQARSSIYSSAVGKALQSPIFHVNGEDPESVAQVVRLVQHRLTERSSPVPLSGIPDRLADTLVVMDAGRAVGQGPLGEMLARLDFPVRLEEEAGVLPRAARDRHDVNNTVGAYLKSLWPHAARRQTRPPV